MAGSEQFFTKCLTKGYIYCNFPIGFCRVRNLPSSSHAATPSIPVFRTTHLHRGAAAVQIACLAAPPCLWLRAVFMRTPPADDKTLLATSVYDALKERVMDQYYPPGARLKIDALAVDLNVSPTPIREALARLLAEHLVTVEPYKGYRISPLLTTQQVGDLMHVRRLIETAAARLAAQTIRTPDLLGFERILKESQTVEVGDWAHGYRHFNLLDQRFHEKLLEVSGNRFLLSAWRSLYVHVELGRFYDVFQTADHEQTCAEHRRICQALAAHAGDEAALAVEEHLAATETRIFSLIDLHAHDADAAQAALANGGQRVRVHNESKS